MAMDRLIGSAVLVVAIGVAAPFLAPGLLQSVVTPVADESAATPVRRSAAPPPAAGSSPIATYGRTVALRADPMGHFETNIMINGRSVTAVVDTGATTVAISADTARQLGVHPPQSAFTLPISTANGTLRAAPVMLNEVRVGGIAVRNVQAVVVPGKALGITLLGMTFLSRLQKFEISRGQLILSE
jgi:aspartyl protease family protein